MRKDQDLREIESISNIEVDRFDKNDTETVITQLTWYYLNDLIDIRIWRETGKGKYVPTKKGITIQRDLFPYLKRAIEKLGVCIERIEELEAE